MHGTKMDEADPGCSNTISQKSGRCISWIGSLLAGRKSFSHKNPVDLLEKPNRNDYLTRPVASSLLRSTTVSAQARTVAAANAHGDVSGVGPENQRRDKGKMAAFKSRCGFLVT